MPELTAKQRLAIDERKSSVVLSSGAGCGKTFVLTARYLSHLEDGAAVGQVVAITFTERAAREMRKRIRTAITQRLAATTTGSSEFLIWRQHLRDLETAPITTIHSFCGNLLRRHAVTAGLDPRFEVLDEVLSANVRADALLASLHGLLTVDPATSPACDLRELVVLFGWGAVREAVESLVLDADRAGWDAWQSRDPEAIAAEWQGRARAELLPRWVEYLCAASPKISGLLRVLGQIPCIGVETRKNVARLRNEVPRLHEAVDLANAIDELKELAKVGKEKAKAWPDEDRYEAIKDAFTQFRGDLAGRFDLFLAGPAGVVEAAAMGQRFLRVAAAVQDEYQKRKRQGGFLDFQDLLVFTRDLLRDHAEVRGELQKRFQFLLLDELQDTDPIQMELIDHLAGADRLQGKLFAVGDHKQSIYRFRGADVGLFRRLRDDVPAAGRLDLSRNYRSQPGVLQFVNVLFAQRVRDYEALEPERESAGPLANVEFLWSEPDAEADENVAAVRRREADAIARRIVRLLADPTPRIRVNDGPPRAVKLGDIVLLFRSMSHAAIYEEAFRRHELDYYLVGGRAFFAQQEVYDLLNLLRAIENPQDGVSVVGTLRSPFCNLSDEAVHLLATHEEGPWAGLFDAARFDTVPADQKPHVERARRYFLRWRSLKDRLPIARLLGEIFADSGYDAALQFEFLGDRKLANLWKLVELARRFDRTGLFGLHEFTARLGDMVARQPREEQAATLPEDADVLRMMSIHQSKGLEFPVVIVPDLAAAARGNTHPVARWDRDHGCLVRLPSEFENLDEEAGEQPPFSTLADRLGRTADQLADWQEDLRILYVACTRAEDLLILSAGLPEPFPAAVGGLPTPFPSKAANHWTLALAERFDPRTGACLAAGVEPEDAPRVSVNVVVGTPESLAPEPAS